MEFGTWDSEKIDNTLIKIKKHYELKKELHNECFNISKKLYLSYLSKNELKKSAFHIFNHKVLSEHEFFDRTAALNIDGCRIYRSNEYLKKYDVKLSDRELKLHNAFEFSYFKYELNDNIKKFKERLTYCIGGEITADEIYLMCDMDSLSNTYTKALETYRLSKD